MFVISFNICLFIYFSVKYAIQSNDCDVFVNKQSIYLSIYLSEPFHPQDLISNSPYCLPPYNSCDVNWENLGLDQLIIPGH